MMAGYSQNAITQNMVVETPATCWSNDGLSDVGSTGGSANGSVTGHGVSSVTSQGAASVPSSAVGSYAGSYAGSVGVISAYSYHSTYVNQVQYTNSSASYTEATQPQSAPYQRNYFRYPQQHQILSQYPTTITTTANISSDNAINNPFDEVLSQANSYQQTNNHKQSDNFRPISGEIIHTESTYEPPQSNTTKEESTVIPKLSQILLPTEQTKTITANKKIHKTSKHGSGALSPRSVTSSNIDEETRHQRSGLFVKKMDLDQRDRIARARTMKLMSDLSDNLDTDLKNKQGLKLATVSSLGGASMNFKQATVCAQAERRTDGLKHKKRISPSSAMC